MRDRTGKSTWFSRKLVAGFLLVGLGVVFFLHNLHMLDLDRIWRYWPMILMVFAIERLINRGPLAMEVHINILGAAFLQLFFLERFSLIEHWWPLAVVWIGIVLVLRALFPKPRRRMLQDSEERMS